MKAPVWERIQQLFDEASALQPGARDTWLEKACGGDRTLLLHVKSLLLAGDDENGFLEREVISYAGRMASQSVPESIGPYKILSGIGSGGMGAVYLAERADGEYERKVAIKLIRAGFAATPWLLQRFRAERGILAGLQHPNIAQMLDGGVTADGIPYLVMEFVEGVRIDEYCARNNFSIRQRLELFRQVCSAVQYAHSNLVVHRDIKPSNILVTSDGSPKLLDFGIAKLTRREDASEDITFTLSVERPMTPEYASPEQIHGKGLTTATDVYSLGVILWELLAGERLFRRTQSDPAALMRAICEQELRRPSAAAAAFAPQLRGDLDQIVMMAMRKEALARYQSVEHLSEDIGRYLGGYPVLAWRGNRRYRAAKFIRRHRVAVAAAAAFTVLAIAFGAALAAQNARVTRERNIAQRERAVSQKVSSFLISLFEASDPFYNKGSQLTARQLLDNGAGRLTKELAGEPVVRAELLETVGQAYKHLGALDQAESMFREKVRAVDQAFGPGSVEAIRILRQLGDTERMRGKNAEAGRDLHQALVFAEHLPPGRDYELAQTLNNLALVEMAAGDRAHAVGHSRRAVAIIARYPKDPGEGLTMQGNLGMILFANGQTSEAEPILRHVADGRRAVLGENHPQTATSMRRLATVVASRGGYVEAEQLYRDAAAKLLKLVGSQHPDFLLTQYYLAGVLIDEGKYSEAEAIYRDTIETERKVAGSRVEVGIWSADLAWTLLLEGKARESDALLGEALTVVRARGGAGTVREARVLVKRAWAQSVLRRLDEAQASADGALAIFADRKTQAGTDAADAHLAAAWIDRLRGANEKARSNFDQAIAADRASPEPDKLALASHLLAEADFLSAVNAAPAAQPLIREALDIRQRQLPDGFWSTGLTRLVQAETAGGAGDVEPILSKLRARLGDNALLTQAAVERAARIGQTPGGPAFRAPLF